MTADLRELLELASDDVPELDLATDAWEEAGRRHRVVVRRSVLGLGATAAAGALLTLTVRDRASGPARPSPTLTPTAAADGTLPTAEIDGVRVLLAPEPAAEAALPRYPGAAELAIPRHLGPSDRSIRADAESVGGLAEPLRAVFLVVAEDRGLHLVLLAPGAPFQVEVTSLRVTQSEGVTSVLGPRSISRDRHRVAIPQPGRVVVLDARDGSVVEVEVPDPTLLSAGWARDGGTVVARGRDAGWLVDPGAGTAHRAEGPVGADWADLAQEESGAVLRTFSGAGLLTGTRPLLGPAVVPSTASVSNTQGWVAGGAFLPGAYQSALGRSQGLVAVHSDLPAVPRVLAATAGPLVPKGGYRALAWAPADVVLFESRSERAGFQGLVRRVLAWDVNEGRLYQVAEVDRAGRGPGEFTGAYAL